MRDRRPARLRVPQAVHPPFPSPSARRVPVGMAVCTLAIPSFGMPILALDFVTDRSSSPWFRHGQRLAALGFVTDRDSQPLVSSRTDHGQILAALGFAFHSATLGCASTHLTSCQEGSMCIGHVHDGNTCAWTRVHGHMCGTGATNLGEARAYIHVDIHMHIDSSYAYTEGRQPW